MTPVPNELHRYFNCTRGVEVLEKRALYFSPINEYNDPFELIPAASSDIFRYTPQEIHQKITEIAKTEEGKKKMEALEESLGIDEFLLGASVAASAIIYPYLTAAIATGLFLLGIIDEEEDIKLLATKYFSIFQTARSCSFSKMYDNILMWSNYAEGHKGIVLSFDTFLKYWHGEEFRKIDYSNERIRLPNSRTDANEYVWKMLTRKSLDWSYEQEYRMIKLTRENTTPEGKGILFPFDSKALKAIRLGLNIEEGLRQRILRLRDERYKDAVVYQAKFNRREYKLDFEQL